MAKPVRARALGRWIGAAALALSVAAPRAAQAFCGFYVSGADARLTNDATMVVLMRDGTRTVLSMRNDYRGPPEHFAMVVPVPVVLQKENVKTLPHRIFERVDTMASPRLVEYWEQDPCPETISWADSKEGGTGTRAKGEEGAMGRSSSPPLVKVEAEFTVGEYEIVILSALDSGALDRWLRESGYRIPAGAEPVLRPYVQAGSKFFVARVDVEKVIFDGEVARLSPLRFHYDTEAFSLPVRLGLLNSAGTQDLVVHVLAPGQRFEVANYPNVTIPTNVDVDDAVRTRFGAFYAALFDRTLEKNPRAVVTEYAWSAGSCDPCPGPILALEELRLLGTDVLPRADVQSMVLTRLHARYGKDALGEDLIFRAAPPITGGREEWRGGALPTEAQPTSWNNFQARYAIRHPWTGPIACSDPKRGVWGGPSGGRPRVNAAQDLGTTPRGGVDLGASLRSDVPSLGLRGMPAPDIVAAARPMSRLSIGFYAGIALGLLALFVERRRAIGPADPSGKPRS
jgi:hypothetical protein